MRCGRAFGDKFQRWDPDYRGKSPAKQFRRRQRDRASKEIRFGTKTSLEPMHGIGLRDFQPNFPF
jgi:hypothetical protein